MSYESPISIIIRDMQKQFNYDVENNILKAVRQYHIEVDKDELLKALEYDRGQYDKGYSDGFWEGRKKAKEEILNDLTDRLKDLIENYGGQEE